MTNPRGISSLRGVWGILVIGGRRFSVAYLMAVIVLLFGLTESGTFLTAPTLRIVLGQQVVVGVLALALLIPLTTGAFDLSVGAMLGFSVVIMSVLQKNHTMPIGPAIAVAIVSCLIIGAINGFVVVKLRVNSFIATLGMSQILVALALLMANNRQISGVFPASFEHWGQRNVIGLPIVFYYLIAIAIVLWIVLEHTPMGRRLYAVGGNVDAARLAGVPTDRLIFGSLVASAGISALAGIIFAAQVGVFDSSFGQPQLFPAFAAVFLGATQIKNRPNVWGTILALYVLQFGAQGVILKFENLSFWVSPLFNGAALVIAVAFASRRRKFRLRERLTDDVKDELPATEDAVAAGSTLVP